MGGACTLRNKAYASPNCARKYVVHCDVHSWQLFACGCERLPIVIQKLRRPRISRESFVTCFGIEMSIESILG
jgi:hypothetical protein